MNPIVMETPVKGGFFNSKTGTTDRVYSAEDFTGYLSSLICNGILDSYGDCFALSYDGAVLTVGTGYAWINGHYAILKQTQNLDLSAYADENLSRYITVGISCDTSDSVRACAVEILPGLAVSGTPVKPTFENTDDKIYLTLCYVLMRAGGTISSIVDTREDETLCGYVKCILGKCNFNVLQNELTALQTEQAELKATVAALQEQISDIGELILYYHNTDVTVEKITAFPDIDGDKKVTLNDASLILKFYSACATLQYEKNLAGWNDFLADNNLDEMEELVADTDGDGDITLNDAYLALMFYANCAVGHYKQNEDDWKKFLIANGVAEDTE